MNEVYTLLTRDLLHARLQEDELHTKHQVFDKFRICTKEMA